MGDLINLVRPDGSILQATEEDAAQLRAYGYKDQTLEEQAVGNINAAKEDYYTTPGQKVKTAVEGLASGMTLGLSDKLLEATTDAGITGDEWRSRSEYNPGTRLGSELVGAILPSVLSGGTLTPAGALVEGSRLATRGVENVVARSAARGALEGAGFGLGAEISHSALTGDPLTVEGSLAGMGWGAVWGGGLGAIGGGIESRIMKKAGIKAEAASAAKLVDETYGAFRSTVREASTKADDAFNAVGSELDAQIGQHKLAKHQAKVEAVEASNAEKLARHEQRQAYKAQMEEYSSKMEEFRAARKAEHEKWASAKRSETEQKAWEAYNKKLDDYVAAQTREGDRAAEMAKIGEQTKARDAFMSDVESRASSVMDEAMDIRDKTFNTSWTEHPGVRDQKKAAIAAYNTMKAARAKKDWAGMEKAYNRFVQRLDEMEKARFQFQGSLTDSTPLGMKSSFEFDASKVPSVDTPTPQVKPGKAPPEPPVFKNKDGFTSELTPPKRPKAPEFGPKLTATPPPPSDSLKAMKDAFAQIKDLGSVSSALRSLPETPVGFSSITPARFEKMSGALETFLKQPAAELSGTQEALKSTVAKMAEQMGLSTEGNTIAQLRGVWETARNIKSASGVEAAEKVASGKTPWSARIAQSAAGVGMTKATGSGFAGYALGRTIAQGLLGVKGAVLSTLSKSAETWMPRASKAVRYLAPQGEPLSVRLDGTIDLKDKRKSQQELMLDRAKEIREVAPTIRDTLYKELRGLNVHYPEYAAALHEQAVNQFTYLYNKLPRDPGNAFNRLQPLPRTDPVEAAKFARTYEIFVNPAKVFQDFMAGRRVSPDAAADLSNMWPALFQYARSRLIERFSDPKILNKMQYDDQVQMSLLTGLRMHSTLRPEFIASQQQMYTQRQTPLPMAAQPGAPGGQGGRPSGESPYMTQAQESTLR